MDFGDKPSTLTNALARTAARYPERGVTILTGRHGQGRIFYSHLFARASEVAQQWTGLGFRPGHSIVLALPTSAALIELWLGAVLCGIRPVAVAPPLPFADLAATVNRLSNVAMAVGARGLVVPDTVKPRFGPDIPALSPEDVRIAPSQSPVADDAAVNDVAFLQLTSGTTSIPCAVAISHQAAITNVVALHDALLRGNGPSKPIDTVVSWLPLHHDLGLVGALLLSIVIGCDLCLIAPQLFLAHPTLWFEQIATRQGVLSLSPNFGLQLCVDRRDAVPESLNLLNWQAAICGGEMLRPDTLFSFAAAYRLPSTVLRPGYGLAEATLAATIDRAGRGPHTRPAPAHTADRFALSEVVSVGAPVSGTIIRIARPDGRVVSEDEEGDVLVAGPGLFSGYIGDAAKTRSVLRDGWLHTGDLGFLHRGELYLTGRKSDSLIIRGATFSPHDLEWIAEAIAGGGGRHRAAAFSIARDNAGELAILAIETGDRDPNKRAAIEADVRRNIAAKLALQLSDIVWLRAGKLPRTTSGKIRRGMTRQLYQRGRLDRMDAAGLAASVVGK
jgi:fatty-acyl-CoA synthase